MAWSLALHLALLGVGVPLYRASEPADPVVTAIDVAAALELDVLPPPTPSDYTLPQREEVDVTPREHPLEDPPLLDADWDTALDSEFQDRVREAISCADPSRTSVRFRAAKRPAATTPPARGPGLGTGEGIAVRAPATRPKARQAPPRPATILAHVAPSYPRTARRRGIEGAVGLRVVVEADGSIGSIDIVTSSGSATLDRAAVAAVNDWEFRPAEVRGQPVRSTLDLPMIRFKLTD